MKEVGLGGAMGRFGAGAGHRELVQDKAAVAQLTRSSGKVDLWFPAEPGPCLEPLQLGAGLWGALARSPLSKAPAAHILAGSASEGKTAPSCLRALRRLRRPQVSKDRNRRRVQARRQAAWLDLHPHTQTKHREPQLPAGWAADGQDGA